MRMNKRKYYEIVKNLKQISLTYNSSSSSFADAIYESNVFLSSRMIVKNEGINYQLIY